MNTVLGVCQRGVVIMFACRLLTRPCSLATCRGDRAKVGAHLNIPFFCLFFSFFFQKEREKKNKLRCFAVFPDLLPPRVCRSKSPNALQPFHRSVDMNVGSLYNCRVPLIKRNTCFGNSAHRTPTILMEIELFSPERCNCFCFKRR